MNLSAIPAAIVGSDLRGGVGLSGGLEGKIAPRQKKKQLFM